MTTIDGRVGRSASACRNHSSYDVDRALIRLTASGWSPLGEAVPRSHARISCGSASISATVRRFSAIRRRARASPIAMKTAYGDS